MLRSLVLSLGIATACGGRPQSLPEGVERLELDPATHWADYILLETPLRPPSSEADLGQVEIYLRVPDGRSIEVRVDEDGAETLAYPVGTIADRVEYVGRGQNRFIADVRGTEITAVGQRFHAYRGTKGDRTLFGYAWTREDAAGHRAATDALVAELANKPVVRRLEAGKKNKLLEGVRRKNECAECHQRQRPDNRRAHEHGLVNRGTDAQGWFTTRDLFRTDAPVESYGRFDPNLADPFVDVQCPDGSTPKKKRGTCQDGPLAIAHYDLNAAVASDDPHARRVCASRRALWSKLSVSAASAMAANLAPCSSN